MATVPRRCSWEIRELTALCMQSKLQGTAPRMVPCAAYGADYIQQASLPHEAAAPGSG